MTINIIRNFDAEYVSRNFVNGSFKESFDAVVTSNGTTVTMSIEKSGTGDLTMLFSDGDTILDTTPALTIALTAGSDASPTENFIYILKSDKILTKSTSDWPSTEHNKIGYFLVPSATFVQGNGVYLNQNWNDFMSGGNDIGHMLHITERSRLLGAVYHKGVAGDGDSGTYVVRTNATPDTVFIKTTAGEVYQLHKHTVPAYDTSGSDSFLVVNQHVDNGGAYDKQSDLYNLLEDANSGSMTGKYFNLVLWGTANKSGEFDPLMINLPTGSYSKQTDAENDVSGFDVFSIPASFSLESSVGFLIARLTMKHSSGTQDLELIGTVDLRGINPIVATNSGGAISTEFSDNTFKIFDESDVTKLLQFQVSGVTTGNTRTLTIPDASGTIFLADGSNAITGGGAGHDQFSDFVLTEHLDHALNLDSDLIMWLRMDDITGNTVTDLTANGNDGTLQADAVQVDGLIGKSVLLDGTDDYILVGNSVSLDENFTAFGISMWIKPNFDQNNATIFRVLDKDNAVGLAIRILFLASIDDWRFQITTDVGTKNCDTTGLTWDANSWHHIVVTYDGTNMRFYWDGVIAKTEPHTGTIINGAGDLFIGVEKIVAGFFDGEMDDVMFFKRNISADEAKELYELGNLDSATSFNKAYYKEYIASRSGFFNHLFVSKDLMVSGEIRTDNLFNVSGNDGITKTINVVTEKTTHTFTFTGGILTAHSTT